MSCYGSSFTFIYLDEVRTSQGTHLLASNICYGDNFPFFLNLKAVLIYKRLLIVMPHKLRIVWCKSNFHYVHLLMIDGVI
jgi:hypothetical protein